MALNIDVSEFLRKVVSVWEECIGTCKNAEQFAKKSAIGAAMEMQSRARNQEAYDKVGKALSSNLDDVRELADVVDHGLTRSEQGKK